MYKFLLMYVQFLLIYLLVMQELFHQQDQLMKK